MVRGDRSHDELGEHGQIDGQLQKVLLRRRGAAIDVDEIAHGVEGVERNAERERQLRQRQEGAKEEVRIFEGDQQRKMENKAEDQNELFSPGRRIGLHGAAKPIRHENGEGQQRYAAQIAPGIEEQTSGQQNGVFPARGNEPVDEKEQWKKIKQETDAAECHAAASLQIRQDPAIF